MYSFNIIITEVCNANCSHCYMSNNSNFQKRTMTTDALKEILSKLPKNTKKVVFTGGEILLFPELLIEGISYIKKINSEVKIELETNGILIYTSTNPLDILKKFKQIGVDSIRFSDDPFHKDGGVNLDKVRKLKEYETKDTPIIKYLVQDKAIDLGNASKLDKKLIKKANCMNTENSKENPYLFIDVEGNISLCTWKCIPPLGNLLENDFDKVISKIHIPYYRNILIGHINEAYKEIDGIDNEEYINENGECSLCKNKTKHLKLN